ncbi:J domain-containing protein required for chloroplast accumulation response 1 isoform X2 [Cannabis sativa]|uniref:J domain-containing protein required for chloroplast accumulation response 1 isoform X2 n=1 Tax=Cannabis sativa TaxID=3483 RepID=UPI0029CA747B|nr:J domain-containing protein required for chloroplast accumulation response 1 isoform X2 [Cannabis sativa]
MERFSQKENSSILLGYTNSLRRSSLNYSGSSSPKTSFRNSSDEDFQDVFGGPPRRFSMPDVRHSNFSDECRDSNEQPLIGSGEKPVFGDEVVSRRRYHSSSDFFDDIFGGDSSVTSTPKKQGREYPFPSSPSSRVLSPLPPRAEPFGTSSSLSQFSLPPNTIKGVELPTFGPPTRSLLKLNDDASLPGSSKEAIQGTEVSSNLVKPDQIDKGATLKKDSGKSSSNSGSGHFHFSIYKWAGKGVPFDIPFNGRRSSRLKEMTKSDEPPLRTDEHSISKNEVQVQSNKQEYESTLDEITADKVDDSVIHPVPQRIMGDVSDKSEKGISTHQPEMKPISSLLFDNDFERDTTNVERAKMSGGQVKGNEAKSSKASSPVVGNSKTVKNQGRLDISGINSEVDSASFFQSSPKKSKESYGRNKVKGRVKDFVKMFNQETPSKPKDGLSFRSQSCKWNNKFNFEVETSINTAVADEKLKMHELSEDLKHSAKPYASTPGSPNQATSTGSFPDNFNVKADESDEPFHENFQIKELPQTVNDNLEVETGPNNQEIQEVETKIREWTRGKEGNIRSLLSTLQYVLWAESGWKPVPLVDIIEGNAVKRSYQKALLCLHPDKLQQKGAATHQKYIAEKVFDILQVPSYQVLLSFFTTQFANSYIVYIFSYNLIQEAWNYFNSLASV